MNHDVIHELTMLYLQSLDLSDYTPEDLLKKYSEVKKEISNSKPKWTF